jgi:antitoxin (DNA-binding transcriptional repressor) of toxin-antitoxin stability system
MDGYSGNGCGLSVARFHPEVYLVPLRSGPMSHVDILQIKAKLSSFVKALESGAETEIVIMRDGKPVAKLVRVATKSKNRRRLGLANGMYPTMTQEEFDASNDKIWAGLYEKDRPDEGV